MSSGNGGGETSDLVVIQPLSATEAIVFGDAQVLDAIGRSAKPIPDGFVSVAQRLAATAPELQAASRAMSGRWVKLTRDSAEALARNGGTVSPGGVWSVLRGPDGRIIQHLEFVDPGKLSQVAAGLPALAGAVAMQMQMAAIERKLDEIAQDLDYVIDHLHDQVVADADANLRVLADVYRATVRNGAIDDDHWDMVANLAQPVRALHELTSRRLDGLHRALARSDVSVAQRAKALNQALHRDRTLFWLEAHVHAELGLLRWQMLYLMRQADQHPETLDALLAELEDERVQRHELLQHLAVDIARYLTDGGRVQSLLERVRIISRFRLDRLLLELEEVLAIYRQELGVIGVSAQPLALPAGDSPIAALPESTGDPLWRDLVRQAQKVTGVVQAAERGVATVRARVRRTGDGS